MNDKRLSQVEIFEMFGGSIPPEAFDLLINGDSFDSETFLAKLRGMAADWRGREVKQMIVLRHDLKMRFGKGAAQASHASMAPILDLLGAASQQARIDFVHSPVGDIRALFPPNVVKWLESGTAKICARVDSEEELITIANNAREAGLDVHLITDAGRTEFKEPTLTACSIGPALVKEIDKITGHLKLM